MVRRKYKIRLTLLAILLVLSLTVEFDYQLWKIDNRQTDLAITESGCVEIIYSDDKSFNLVNPEATKDSDGPRTIPKTISISNNCSDIKTINVTMDVLNTSSIESNKVKVYINGEYLGEIETSIKPYNNLLIGTAFLRADRAIIGQISSIKIWNKNLEADDIQNINMELEKTNIQKEYLFKEISLNCIENIEEVGTFVGDNYSFILK